MKINIMIIEDDIGLSNGIALALKMITIYCRNCADGRQNHKN